MEKREKCSSDSNFDGEWAEEIDLDDARQYFDFNKHDAESVVNQSEASVSVYRGPKFTLDYIYFMEAPSLSNISLRHHKMRNLIWLLEECSGNAFVFPFEIERYRTEKEAITPKNGEEGDQTVTFKVNLLSGKKWTSSKSATGTNPSFGSSIWDWNYQRLSFFKGNKQSDERWHSNKQLCTWTKWEGAEKKEALQIRLIKMVQHQLSNYRYRQSARALSLWQTKSYK